MILAYPRRSIESELYVTNECDSGSRSTANVDDRRVNKVLAPDGDYGSAATVIEIT